jgi:hypothetical protein
MLSHRFPLILAVGHDVIRGGERSIHQPSG